MLLLGLQLMKVCTPEELSGESRDNVLDLMERSGCDQDLKVCGDL